MLRRSGSRQGAKAKGLNSFTLVELLTVIAIIAILSSLVLSAGITMMTKASRSRASAEIQAMSTALESYKTDNGIYPVSAASPMTTNYSTYVPATDYLLSGEALYLALSGQTVFGTAPAAGTKSYMTFKRNQVGDVGTTASYVMDPWRNCYGYSTGNTTTPSYPFNGNGFFDLWSSGGLKTPSSNTNTWITNWQ